MIGLFESFSNVPSEGWTLTRDTTHARTRPASVHPQRSGKTRAKRPAAKSAARAVGAVGAPRASLALEHVEALIREQQRIERRGLILGCGLNALDPAPLREALAELLEDIRAAARAIGTLPAVFRDLEIMKSQTGHGGRRLGAGKPKGRLWRATLDKQAAARRV